MIKAKDGFRERRRYVRLKTPVELSYFSGNGQKVSKAVTTNISADGLRFQTEDRDINDGDSLELKLSLTGAANPVHAKAKVVWKKRLSLEDGSPFDVGLEFIAIEEDNKNTFLKNFCDLMYSISENCGKPR
ncbi:MAG: PilZ domain-containing protein [Candidatus Omnitrophica bacterium]|nr:PilZ domain-containing protein [Candidatus Omnitrophota bacterium]